MAFQFSPGQYFGESSQSGRGMFSGEQAGIDIAQRQQGMSEEQWEFQKQMYLDRFEAAKKGTSSLTEMVNQYNTAYAEARQANEQRYSDMLGLTDQSSNQRARDIRADAMGQQSDMMNQLARLGMGNTTVGYGLEQGINRGMQENLNRAADQMQGTKLGIMERRTDAYPDNNVILALANSLGQNSGGQGMGGIMGALGGMTFGGSQGPNQVPLNTPAPVGPAPPVA